MTVEEFIMAIPQKDVWDHVTVENFPGGSEPRLSLTFYQYTTAASPRSVTVSINPPALSRRGLANLLATVRQSLGTG